MQTKNILCTLLDIDVDGAGGDGTLPDRAEEGGQGRGREGSVNCPFKQRSIAVYIRLYVLTSVCLDVCIS